MSNALITIYGDSITKGVLMEGGRYLINSTGISALAQQFSADRTMHFGMQDAFCRASRFLRHRLYSLTLNVPRRLNQLVV